MIEFEILPLKNGRFVIADNSRNQTYYKTFDTFKSAMIDLAIIIKDGIKAYCAALDEVAKADKYVK